MRPDHRVRLSMLLVGLVIALTPVATRCATPLRVAILDDDMPGLDTQRVACITDTLTAAGAEVSTITSEQLSDPTTFSRSTHDVLVLSDSPLFPGQARGNVTAFLQAGGHLVLLGGRAYATPLCKVNGQWCDRAQFAHVLEALPADRTLLSFEDPDTSAWQRSTNTPEHPSGAVSAPGFEGRCLRLELRSLGQWQWDTYANTIPHSIAADQDLLCLHVRGPEGTPQVAIEVDEADGSRWVAALDLTRDWRRYVLEFRDFHFLKDGSPAGRGGPEDRLHLDRANRISFGLASGLTSHLDGDHAIEIDEVGTAHNGLGVTTGDFTAPNSVCFDDYEPYVLRGAVQAAACPDQEFAPAGARFEGPLEGLSAVGFTLWDRSELLPMLQAEDLHGRRRGWACSTVVHYGGVYRGGCWLISGVTTPEFYLSQAFADCLTRFVQAVSAGDLVAACAGRNTGLQQVTIPLQTPAAPPLRRSPDGHQFFLPDGRPLFLMGCNYIGSLDRKFFGGPWLHWLERDFRAAHEAGLNCMRVYGASTLYRDPEKLAALKECARRYGIYLLVVVVDHTDLLTREELQERGKLCAEAFRDETMLLGYDLQNEPYTYKLAAIKDGEQTLGDRHPLWKRWGEYEQWAGLQMAGNFTSFPGVNGPLPRNEQWGPVLDATDGIFSDWVRWQVEAIRSVDSTHPITVGYNTVFDCLPANRQLDFISHHAYQAPVDLEGVMRNLTTLDRLRSVWPDRPITLGEFGYTNGAIIGGRYLDLHTSALGEFLHYLYAFSRGFSGCMKWVLTDHPLELSRQQCSWIPPDDLSTHIDQGRYGFFYSNGTGEPQPKPLVWALRFLREYIDAGGGTGDLQVVPAPTPIGAGYVFRAPRALFAGNTTYESPELQFTSAEAANLLLRWDDRSLRLLSTADATARLTPRAFLPAAESREVNVSGKLAAWEADGDRLQLELLEGETIVITQ